MNATDPGSSMDLDQEESLTDRIIINDPNQMLIPNTGGIYSVERTLIIHNTMGTDTGTYECRADNTVPPNATREFELFVQGKFMFIFCVDPFTSVTNS